ncbi:MAG TPA: hypothetical protein VFI02_13400 [Armatimonadota bacterium]|nr:hypothetical protein [Armatimonadota bacterium]
MRWFYVVMVAGIAAVSAIAIARLANYRPVIVEAVVAASIIVIIIGLFGFLAKSKE